LDASDQFEEFTVIWLDDAIDYGPDYYTHIVCLRNIISHLEIFSNLDDFLDYVNSVNNERVIVLVSGAFCPQIERISDEICEISNIYILCSEDKINHYEAIACKNQLKI
jgi:phosphate uptake regulator